VPGGREPGHIQARLGEDHLGGVPADPGDPIQPGDRRPHCRVRALARAGGPAGVHAAGGRDRRDQLLNTRGELADLGGEGVDLVQQHPGQLAVMVIELAGKGLGQSVCGSQVSAMKALDPAPRVYVAGSPSSVYRKASIAGMVSVTLAASDSVTGTSYAVSRTGK
jgi:hypothetical protein